MTNKEARDKMIAIKAKFQAVLDMYYNGEEVTDAFDVAIEALDREPKTDYKAFAEWVATEIFDDMWEYNKDAFAEIVCRKLSKLGIVKEDGDKWVFESELPIVKSHTDILDKIRAETEQAFCKVENDYDRGRNYGLYMAMQIIDKYRGEV